MKNYFLFLLLMGLISQAQTYVFTTPILKESTISEQGSKTFTELSLMNPDNLNYVLYINEDNGVIRDQSSGLIHLFNFQNNKSVDLENYIFEYKYSIKMLKSPRFKDDIYDIQKKSDTEIVITKYKNKKRRTIEKQYTAQLEESLIQFLYLPFEKNIDYNNRIMEMIKFQLDPNKNYRVKSFQLLQKEKTENSKFTYDDSIGLIIELPKNLKIISSQ